MPFAWAGRKPGWEPASARMVSTSWATTVFGATDAGMAGLLTRWLTRWQNWGSAYFTPTGRLVRG